MSQKNKIFSITLSLLILGSVACRKSGGGGDPTPQNPNMSIGNLLIISTNGKDTVQGISLRFDYADATVSDVVIESTNDMKDGITKDNFLIENNTLKLKDVDLTAKKAAVSNLATLTFSLTPNSATPITKYTETADIYIGKMQTNIGTNDLATKISKAINNDKQLNVDANKSKLYEFEYNYSLSENTDYLVFTNNKLGDAGNDLSIKRFSDFISTDIIDKNWKSHGDSYRLENTIENETNLITKLIFEPTIFCNPYNFKFVITNGKWIESDGQEGK